MKRTWLPDIISFLLILMYTYAAISKLLDFGSFKIQMRIQPIPQWSVIPLVYGVPTIEIITVVCLFFKATRTYGLWASTSLMTVFSTYVGFAMLDAFGDKPCTCGGIISHLSWPKHFLFNLFFLLLSIYGLIIDYRERRFIGK